MMLALKEKKILIASGPTFAPIDAVRCITNRSTGRLGSTIAHELHEEGAQIIFLAGETSCTPLDLYPEDVFHRLSIESFFTVDDLKQRLHTHLASGTVDAVLMAAAVLDYLPVQAEEGKKSSQDEEWTVTFRRGEKLIELLRGWDAKVTIVGFKLETHITLPELIARAEDLMRRSDARMVVANRLEEIDDGTHTAYLVQQNQGERNLSPALPTREAIAAALVQALARCLVSK
ncbi:MAG: phosphopantothenoylcysteine decarboxylase [bacterium]|jgi:phosphopantothenoylcysteine synthetase/decarboxylase|nr:phosphopantothenoylcysteine decarboxylase [bacterium]